MRLILCLIAVLPMPAFAQDWALRAGDVPLSRPQVVALTTDATLTFYDDGQSRFGSGGGYSYTYADGGGTARGNYRVEEDGTVCIAYENGRSRCDRYVQSGGRLVMLTERGLRFPLRP
ncbi:hypothetical protein [Sulfitobacter sabulilitoris]|uniref:Uncharacterized protein n=1 Tax=Sulfitobacter sabulilitoris TaxID=2562655 RepID=A0A5S3PHY9_9RHOB|nr:hypothetical protein [Sulfitobacter sabulilitoris]TMM52961.1 hypothetical protein FDT80_12010 [Sulfitobacter sabulilitoris]